MPSLTAHPSNEFVKLLYIGDSKAGKTGSLVSLVKAGYKIRILDLDNLLDVLRGFVLKECPDKIDNVEYRTLRDKMKSGDAGTVINGPAKAYINTIKMVDNWKYKDEDGNEIDYGKPCDWGPDCILVIDSLSRLCDAAYEWRLQLTPPGPKVDGRMVYKDAQDNVEGFLSLLTSDAFQTNVIVIAHVMYQEQADGVSKGFPQGIGQKLSPKIPQYFPVYALADKKGTKRVIRTTSTPLIDLANPKPFEVASEYPLETGLAQFFEVLRGPLQQEAPTKQTKTK